MMKHTENDRTQIRAIFTTDSMRKNIILWGMMIMLTACMNPILNFINKNIINSLSSDIYVLKTILLVLIGYMVLQFLCELLENLAGYFGTKLFYLINSELIKEMNCKLSKITFNEYESPEIYNLITRIRNGIEKTSFAGLGNIIAVITSVVTLIGNIIILFTIKKYFPIIVIIASLPYALVILLQGKDYYDYTKKANPLLRKERYINDIMTSRDVIKDIRFFELVDYIADKAQLLRNEIYILRKKLDVKLFKRDVLTNFLRNLALAICLFIICNESIGGEIKAGDIVFLINTIQAITSTVTAISSNMNSINEFIFFKKDWEKLMKVCEEKMGKEKVVGYDIKFENVSFAYSEKSPNVLTDVSLEIRENEKIAIVGENGCGKSTLISLMLGLYKPLAGKIYVGNCDINDSLSDIRRMIVCIFQNYNKYQMSVADNIYAGNFGKSHNTNSVIEKASFIADLPMKENTILGQLEEGARELSGGQWQQIAIMRALYREDAKIIIMDEPTASIDPKTENDFYENLTEISQGKTLVLVSHRLSAASLCDKIIVLSEGKIAEMGTHKELLELKGMYYQMYTCQKGLYE